MLLGRAAGLQVRMPSGEGARRRQALASTSRSSAMTGNGSNKPGVAGARRSLRTLGSSNGSSSGAGSGSSRRVLSGEGYDLSSLLELDVVNSTVTGVCYMHVFPVCRCAWCVCCVSAST